MSGHVLCPFTAVLLTEQGAEGRFSFVRAVGRKGNWPRLMPVFLTLWNLLLVVQFSSILWWVLPEKENGKECGTQR